MLLIETILFLLLLQVKDEDDLKRSGDLTSDYIYPLI